MEDVPNAEAECLQLFLKISLDERTAKNAIVNSKLTASLSAIIHEAGVEEGCSKSIGNLLYLAATKYPANALKHRPFFVQYIVASKIKNANQLEKGLLYLASIGPENVNVKEFEKACGIGIVVLEEDIINAIDKVVQDNVEAILEQRYRINAGKLYSEVRKMQPWTDPIIVKGKMDKKLLDVLGERTEADNEKPVKKKNEKASKAAENVAYTDKSLSAPLEEVNPFVIFIEPTDNIQVHTEISFSDGSVWRPHNSKVKLETHLLATDGKVYTRFPPEPNGYLHIGHAKALYINFGLAKERNGCCYLRFDDTNPEAEKKEYIDHMQEIISWIGWKPFKITYTSDYFQELYDLAVELIKRERAYVDHQTSDEIKEHREKKLESPWRNRPIIESLKLFDEMRMGMIPEGKATLRMKQDMKSDNYNMYDLIAYRIKFTPHPLAGDKWHIYPSYDYAHCIVDSLENITHSLCSLEFESRRASYYWLLESLDLYLPYVWEFSRLNLSNTVLSKRKLNRLVKEKWVDSWDDPRLLTLAGLRRRGVSPDAINRFIKGSGISRSDNIMLRLSHLEYYIREEMNKTSPRAMVVLRPLKVVITNMKVNTSMEIEAKIWPDAKDSNCTAFYKVPFTNTIFIEKTDFRLKDSKDYYGLAPGKTVMLRYAFPIKCTNVIFGEDKETVLEVHAEYDPTKSGKPKGVLHWVAKTSMEDPLKVEVRLFDKLFMSEDPSELDDWLDDLNPKSREVINEAYAVPCLAHAKHGDKFQFERLGYFAVDMDSSPEKIVFNRTVTLRDSYAKESLGR